MNWGLQRRVLLHFWNDERIKAVLPTDVGQLVLRSIKESVKELRQLSSYDSQQEIRRLVYNFWLVNFHNISLAYERPYWNCRSELVYLQFTAWLLLFIQLLLLSLPRRQFWHVYTRL